MSLTHHTLALGLAHKGLGVTRSRGSRREVSSRGVLGFGAKPVPRPHVVPCSLRADAGDPGRSAVDERERGRSKMKALGSSLAGIAASIVIAGAAGASEVIDVAEIASGLYNSGADIGMGMGAPSEMKGMQMPPSARPRAGEPKGSHASPAWEVWAYSQGAPPYIGDAATVVGGDGQVKRQGSNEWTCLAGNGRERPADGWPSPHVASPICADPEGMKWIQAYVSGAKPKLERDTIIYMQAGDEGYDNTDPSVIEQKDAKPGQWIESGGHVMLMPKDPKSIAKFTSDFNTGNPYVMFGGTPYAHLMIPTDGAYYQYQKGK